LVYIIGKKIFTLKEDFLLALLVITTLLHSFYFEMTLVNAENFFVPLVLGGFITVYNAVHTLIKESRVDIATTLASGFLFALATWTKLTVVPEIIMLVVVAFVVALKNNNKQLSYFSKNIPLLSKFDAYFLAPGVIIWGITALFFAIQGSFNQFIRGVIGFSGNYLSFSQDVTIFGFPIELASPMMINAVIVALVFLVSSYFYISSSTVDESDNSSYVILNWIFVATFCVFLSSRGYPHYFQQLLPALSLAIILLVYGIIHSKDWKNKVGLIVGPVIVLSFILNSFTNGSGIINWFRLNTYYGGFISYVTGEQTYEEWNSEFDRSGYSRRTALEKFVNNTRSSDVIYVLGSSPEIYAFTETLPGYNLIVDYHLSENDTTESIMDTLVENDTTDIYVLRSSSRSGEFQSQLTTNGYSINNTLSVEDSVYLHYSSVAR
jgi:hypothetical protein